MGHLSIDGDHHLLLLTHDGVSLLHLVIDPSSEIITENDCANVHHPLLGHLGEIDFVRKEVVDVGLVSNELENAVDGKALVLGHKDCVHLLVRHVGLLPAQNVLQEIDGDIVCTK